MVAGPCKVARAAQDCQEEEKIAVVRPIVPKGSRSQNSSNLRSNFLLSREMPIKPRIQFSYPQQDILFDPQHTIHGSMFVSPFSAHPRMFQILSPETLNPTKQQVLSALGNDPNHKNANFPSIPSNKQIKWMTISFATAQFWANVKGKARLVDAPKLKQKPDTHLPLCYCFHAHYKCTHNQGIRDN